MGAISTEQKHHQRPSSTTSVVEAGVVMPAGTIVTPQKKKRRRRRNRKNKHKYQDFTSHSTHSMMVHPSVHQQRFTALNMSQHVGTFSDASQVLAMDCEMVGCGDGGRVSVLARVSLVDFHGKAVLDVFVKVQEPVTDYRTWVSGVKPSDLTGPNAVEFDQARNKVRSMLQDKILVGHGLENDLKALGMKHPWYMTRDSVLYAPLLRFNGRPRRLKDLAWNEVGLDIQRDGEVHDSIEDANAAMEVYKHHQGNWDYEIRCQLAASVYGY